MDITNTFQPITDTGAALDVPVSQRNYNRYKYKTHTLPQVLIREGHRIIDGIAYLKDYPEEISAWPLISINLVLRRKQQPA